MVELPANDNQDVSVPLAANAGASAEEVVSPDDFGKFHAIALILSLDFLFF